MSDNNLISGFLLVNKPQGMSSFDVIRQLRKQTGIRTFGHSGTLDPFATGLLIVAVNKYTKLISLMENLDKTYLTTMTLGTSTTTGDPEGEVAETSDVIPDPESMDQIGREVLQLRKLKPPLYSAVQIGGQRAYARARKGEDFDLPERDIRVHEFNIINFQYPDFVYSCRVSKGTYIRSLSQWIANRLKTVGFTNELVREAIGDIKLERAIEPENINADTIKTNLVTILDIMPQMETVNPDEEEMAYLRNGRTINNTGKDNPVVLLLDENSVCVGYGSRENNILRPRVNL
jgi:tRNA pseudouridine55 synthase